MLLLLTSCGGGRKIASSRKQTTVKKTESNQINSKNDVVQEALKFKGTRYKYGGNSRKGMDCSGLIYQSYNAVGVKVPRTTGSLYKAAKNIKLDQVVEGDLLFFGTGKNNKKVNHVGMVVQVTPAEIIFIHSTTSRGVITSSINEPYWLKAYIGAGRL
ncbi:MAG: C40 family peptidase [Nonlabens sp.]